MAHVSTVTGSFGTYYSGSKGNNTRVYSRAADFTIQRSQRIGKLSLEYNRHHNILKSDGVQTVRRSSNHYENNCRFKNKPNRQIDTNNSRSGGHNKQISSKNDENGNASRDISKNAHNLQGQNGRNQTRNSSIVSRINGVDNQPGLRTLPKHLSHIR